MEFGIEKCAIQVMKTVRRKKTGRIELPNQERIKTLGENESYLEILDTIKQSWKKNQPKNSSDKGKNFSKPNSAAEILSEGKASR